MGAQTTPTRRPRHLELRLCQRMLQIRPAPRRQDLRGCRQFAYRELLENPDRGAPPLELSLPAGGPPLVRARAGDARRERGLSAFSEFLRNQVVSRARVQAGADPAQRLSGEPFTLPTRLRTPPQGPPVNGDQHR